MRVWPRASTTGRNVYFKCMVGLLVIVAILLIEEINVGTGFVSVMNYYGKEVVIPITAKRDNKVRIAIVVIVLDNSNKEQYEEAQDTITCYAAYHRYPYHFIVVKDNATLSQICPQKDFMFQRHCVVAHMMTSWNEEWLLFLDADMAIINPNHLIEEYIPIDPEIHVVFYRRLFNHEVMAGSYLIRNSEYSHNFLMHWSNYEYKLPKSFHGSDNGAIHTVIVSYELPSQDGARQKCEEYWKVANDYNTLSIYEVCMQMILSAIPLKHVLILQKGSSSWARDGWLTNSAWSEKDFVLHGWQKRRKDKMRFARWHSPLVDTAWNATLCEGSNSYLNWRYKDSFIEKNEEIEERLDVIIQDVQKDYESIRFERNPNCGAFEREAHIRGHHYPMCSCFEPKLHSKRSIRSGETFPK